MGIYLFCALGLLVVLLLYIVIKIDRKRFEMDFPPISDAEFIARCKAGTDPKVALKVRRIVAENLGAEYDRIYPSTHFAEDLGAD